MMFISGFSGNGDDLYYDLLDWAGVLGNMLLVLSSGTLFYHYTHYNGDP